MTNNQNGISTSSENNLVYNNTVYGNGVGQSCGGTLCNEAIAIYGSGNIVKNNIVYGNKMNSIQDSGTGTIKSNNLTTNPSFIDAVNGNFQLQAGSPAIDTGISTIATRVTIPYNGQLPISALER